MKTKLLNHWSGSELNTMIKSHEDDGWVVDRTTFQARGGGTTLYAVLVYKRSLEPTPSTLR